MKTPDFLQGVGAKPSAPKLKMVSWHPTPPPPPSIPPAVVVMAPPPVAPAPVVVAPPAPLPDPLPAPSGRGLDSEKLKLAIEALRAQGKRLAEQARSDSLELGVIIARRILEREINSDLGAIFSLIKSAIRRAGEDHVTRVRVHPKDAAAFADSGRSEFSLGTIEIAPDASLERGDVMVDTEHHSIDGRLSTRMNEIVKLISESGA
ncbi:MAG: FliH/SctL family protein [Archangium sp.]